MADNLQTFDDAVHWVLMSELHIIKEELKADIPETLRTIRDVELNCLTKILDRANRIMTDTNN